MSRTRRKNLPLQCYALEERCVPANNLTVVDDFTGSSGIVSQTTGNTITVKTTGMNAQIALGDIEGFLATPGITTVVLSTEADAVLNDFLQAGDIEWDYNTVGSDMSLVGLGTGKTLKLVTHNSSLFGDINLTGTYFTSFTNDT